MWVVYTKFPEQGFIYALFKCDTPNLNLVNEPSMFPPHFKSLLNNRCSNHINYDPETHYRQFWFKITMKSCK